MGSFIMGLSAAIMQGTLLQMAAFISPDSDLLKVAVSSGFIASGIFILILSFLSGFGRSSSSSGIYHFYESIFVLDIVCFVTFILLLLFRKVVTKSIIRRDSQIQDNTINDMKLIKSNNGIDIELDAEIDDLKTSNTSMSYWEVYEVSKLCCFSIFLTVASGSSVGAYFTTVKCVSTTLPQTLFFVHLFGNFFGRPIALFLPVKSDFTLAILSLIRLLLVILFFIAGTAEWFPRNDKLLIILVAVLASMSGYLYTVCLQVAPTKLPLNYEESSLTKQANMLNLFFSASMIFGIYLSFFIFLAVK